MQPKTRVAAASGLSGLAIETGYLLVRLAGTARTPRSSSVRRVAESSAQEQRLCCKISHVSRRHYAPRACGHVAGTLRLSSRYWALAFIPASTRFLADWGWRITSVESLARSCCAVELPTWLLRAEIVSLDVGLLASLYLAYRIATKFSGSPSRPWAAAIPWCALTLMLFGVGVCILLQPMEMRGAHC